MTAPAQTFLPTSCGQIVAVWADHATVDVMPLTRARRLLDDVQRLAADSERDSDLAVRAGRDFDADWHKGMAQGFAASAVSLFAALEVAGSVAQVKRVAA